MGDSLAFNISVPAARLDALLELLVTRLEGQALADLMPAVRAGTMVDLTLRCPSDAVLDAFAQTHPELQSSGAGVVFGYLTLASKPRDAHFDLSFFSSCRAIVELLRYSQQVRSFFQILAEFADPPELRVVDEWGDVVMLQALPADQRAYT